jgi:hypothetical protein
MTSTFASLLLGCVQPQPDVSGPLKAPEPNGEVLLADAHNYSFEGLLDGPSFPMAQLQDVELDWAELRTDLQCHALDPVAEVDTLGLMVFPYLSQEEVELGLSYDTLQQVDLGVYLEVQPGTATRVSLKDFTFFGTEADIDEVFEPGSGAWMISLSTGNQIGVNNRMIAFLEPRADSEELLAVLDDGCPVLDWSVDLGSLREAPVLPQGPWELDWSAVAENSMGMPFQPGKVSHIMVGRFEEDLPELEAGFLELEDRAAELYTMEHPGGLGSDLSELRDAEGRNFEGFSGEGTWLFSLRCETCANPAPLFLTVLLPWSE